jgi:vacuolar-type H+-ATPase subunit C/Vma6
VKSLARYATTNAITRTMLSELLTRADFGSIVRAESTQGAWLALRKTSYGRWIPDDVPGDTLAIEKTLREVSASRFKKSISALRGEPKDVGVLLLTRWELDNLELALRVWHGKSTELQRFLTFPSQVHNIAIYDIVEAETLEEIAIILRETPYFEPISQSLRTYRDKRSVFFVEVGLERDYYARLLEAAAALGGSDARQSEKIVSSEIDMLNLSWLARLLAYYEVQPSGFHQYVIPGPSEISRRLSDPALTAQSLKQLQVDFAGGLIGRRGEGQSDLDRVALLEGLVRELAVDTARGALAGYPFSMGCVFAFYLLKRVELGNLVTVFSGKSADAPEAVITDKLHGLR